MTALPPFAAWSGAREKVRMLILGEAWGQSEEAKGFPFVGASGKELFKILGEAEVGERSTYEAAKQRLYGPDWLLYREYWMQCSGIAMTNVLALRPRENKLENICVRRGEGEAIPGLKPFIVRPFYGYLPKEHEGELRRLEEEIRIANPNLILALGTSALWALAPGAQSDLRGTVMLSGGGAIRAPGVKFLPTYHPAGVLRQWSWRSIVVSDVIKAWAQSATAEFSRPRRSIIINPNLEDIHSWAVRVLANPPPVLSCDIETKAGQITSIGFAAARQDGITIPFVELGDSTFRSYWTSSQEEAEARKCVRKILESPVPKLFHNGVYDIQWLVRDGFRIANIAEDSMLLHHAIHPEMRKALGFLGSIYTNEPAWKIMRRRTKDEGEKDEGE